MLWLADSCTVSNFIQLGFSEFFWTSFFTHCICEHCASTKPNHPAHWDVFILSTFSHLSMFQSHSPFIIITFPLSCPNSYFLSAYHFPNPAKETYFLSQLQQLFMLMTSMPPWVIHACVFHLRYCMFDDPVMISFILLLNGPVKSLWYHSWFAQPTLLLKLSQTCAYILFLSMRTNCWTEEASGLVRAHESLDGGLEVLCKIESL
jgi:hypothetical protein